jgi:hypothetical protein
MFRARLTLLFLSSIVLVVAVVWVILDFNREAYVRDQVAPSIKAAVTSWKALAENRNNALKKYVGFVMQSDLPRYLTLLREYRQEIKRVGDRTREEFPSRRNVPPERILKFVETEAKDALARFESGVQSSIKQPYAVEGGYPRYMRDLFASCLAESEVWPLCYFKLTYLPLTQIIFPAQKKQLGAAMPELFVLVDPDGRTTRLYFENLANTVDVLRVQDPDQAASNYRTHVRENFQQSAPMLEQLKSSFEPTISGFFVSGSHAFVAVAARIEAPSGDFLGALIVGYEVGRGRAMRDTVAAMGWRPVLEQCMDVDSRGEPDNRSSNVCEFELSRVDKGILYVFSDNGKNTVVGSPSPAQDAPPELTQYLRDAHHFPAYSSESMLAASVPVPMDFVAEGQGLYAVFFVDLAKALPGFRTIKVILMVFGLVLFLVSLIIIQILMRSFNRPFEKIDAAVHEVIGGNFDVMFPFDFQDQLPRAMGQSLCVMKAVLLGQPLPEDVEQQDGWSGDLRIAGAYESEAGGMDIPDGETPEVIDELPASKVTESATDYYKRIFREYVDARTAAGLDTSKVTYIRFVEKIAKTEMALRERYGCKQVIFKVVRKDAQVSLIPVKIVEDAPQPK